MRYWGWRPLIFWGFISVIVIGCSTATPIAPPATPTEYPPVTLTIRILASPTQLPVIPSLPTPTSLPVTPTLLPPSPPTTVVYVVREGDTLLGIAINFGVEVADLQTANEGLDPRALQIGQQLIIPPPRAEASETSVTDNTLPTSTPAALTLQAPSCFPSQVGGMMCLGEVQNTLNIPLERVAIAVQMLAADGTPIQEVVAIVEQRIIPIGGTAPYRAQLNANQNDVRLDTVLLSADEAQRVEQRFIVLQVLDEQVVYEQGRYIISARVRNPDVVNALAVRATLTILGANGRVLGYRVAQVRDVIAPGEDAPLQMDVIPQVADDAATHTLYVEAQRGAE